MLNPLSAIKWSPFSRRSMRPLSCTIFRSLVLPDHSFEMKVKAPQGAIPSNNISACIMLFVVTPCGLLSTRGCGLLNEKLSCTSDNSGGGVFFEILWKLSLDLFTGRPAK